MISLNFLKYVFFNFRTISLSYCTGGTMVQVLTDLVNRGADSANIRIISAIAAPPALNKLNGAFPGLKIYTGIIDAELNDKGYIVPGMGDAGDRAFGNS
jgi:uracil phosphoribosyltransferase